MFHPNLWPLSAYKSDRGEVEVSWRLKCCYCHTHSCQISHSAVSTCLTIKHVWGRRESADFISQEILAREALAGVFASESNTWKDFGGRLRSQHTSSMNILKCKDTAFIQLSAVRQCSCFWGGFLYLFLRSNTSQCTTAFRALASTWGLSAAWNQEQRARELCRGELWQWCLSIW